MNKLEKTLFEDLTKQAGFYIKDYYSEYLKNNKWIAIMENKDFIYAVIVCKDNESNFEYYEARAFLEKHYSLRIVLNVVICAIGEYESFIHQGYNKIFIQKKNNK